MVNTRLRTVHLEVLLGTYKASSNGFNDKNKGSLLGPFIFKSVKSNRIAINLAITGRRFKVITHQVVKLNKYNIKSII